MPRGSAELGSDLGQRERGSLTRVDFVKEADELHELAEAERRGVRRYWTLPGCSVEAWRSEPQVFEGVVSGIAVGMIHVQCRTPWLVMADGVDDAGQLQPEAATLAAWTIWDSEAHGGVATVPAELEPTASSDRPDTASVQADHVEAWCLGQ